MTTSHDETAAGAAMSPQPPPVRRPPSARPHAGDEAVTDDEAVAGAVGEAAARAAEFVHAIVWAEHTTLWDLLSDTGRDAALSVAVRNGLDRVAAGRIHDDLADPAEREHFLQQLVGGLRRDLRSVELTELTAGECRPATGGTMAVELLTPSLLPGTDAWPAGRLVLSRDPIRGWLVDRLEPRLAGP